MKRAARGISRSVAKTSLELENPQADGDLRGDHVHFLERLNRLSEAEARLAYALYYKYALRRYIARSVLGLKPYLVGPENARFDPASKTVAVELEPGGYPSRLLMDGRGKLKTLLAADMAVVADVVVPFDLFEELCNAHEDSKEGFRVSRKRAKCYRAPQLT